MTPKEALEYWKFKLERARNYTDDHWEADERYEHEEYVEALQIAVVALEKQIPMNPIERIATSPEKIGNGIFGSGVKVHNCPNCNGVILPVHQCCCHCGQKLDRNANDNTNDNTCICCGEIIPEGRQGCPKCERG